MMRALAGVEYHEDVASKDEECCQSWPTCWGRLHAQHPARQGCTGARGVAQPKPCSAAAKTPPSGAGVCHLARQDPAARLRDAVQIHDGQQCAHHHWPLRAQRAEALAGAPPPGRPPAPWRPSRAGAAPPRARRAAALAATHPASWPQHAAGSPRWRAAHECSPCRYTLQTSRVCKEARGWWRPRRGARVRAAQETGVPFALGGPAGPPRAARAAACALP